MTIEDLENLQAVLNDSIDSLKRYYTDISLDFPSLDGQYSADAAESLRSDPKVSQAILNITAASYQLLCTVRPPMMSIFDAATSYLITACLRVTEQINAVELLRDFGAQGLHVNDIALYAGMEPTKLARVFRLLATHHIFREVQPNVFANNRISSVFDSGKDARWLSTQPQAEKHKGTYGAAAFIDHAADECCKSACYLYETLSSPETSHNFKANQAALQTCFKTDKVLFAWLEEPFNQRRFERYGAAIRASSFWNDPKAIINGYDWGSLTANDLIVDVGGGHGMPSLMIARANAEVRIIIQDREAVTEQGKVFWREVFPKALDSGRVSFQAHEFFDKQPQRDVSVFVLRTVLHDWPDKNCVTILKHLRDAAGTKTKLLIGDWIIPLACSEGAEAPQILGALKVTVPSPLLANHGRANSIPYALDMAMQVILNGQERTLAHHADLAARGGWRISQVNPIEGSCFGYMVAEPV
ncbi:O-methyltransferase [Gloeophyllum trabeum ATCC 11539]|uniref:O-methyltransferase n=1 Tax=Gloeophyllum trabeum (strain ATCC 11539 / FP-39264 / Madison 617) TaxID=670483 RepID=S7RKA5_GLOTA|nr:O-methyltransferase [Gloeophyllum trabeum ATCC 11539]EPQ54825.1 O-methyltransferase [Gloeophyllum trabeum ATCC 11539]